MRPTLSIFPNNRKESTMSKQMDGEEYTKFRSFIKDGDRQHLNKFMAIAYGDNLWSYCVFSELGECDSKPIKAHSISKSSMLKKICGEDGMLIELDYYPEMDGRGNITGNIQYGPYEVPIAKASVFNGLCAEHEKRFFGIDQGNPTSQEDLFWLTFRVAAKGFWHYQNEMAKLPEFEKLNIAGYQPRDTESWHASNRDSGLYYLKSLNHIGNSGDFEFIKHIRNTYEDPYLRIACSFALTPNFWGARVGSDEMPAAINIFPLDESRTEVIVSMPTEQMDIFLGNHLFFVDKDLGGQRQQQDWLSQHLLLSAHNLYFGPDYWGGFTKEKKRNIRHYVTFQNGLLNEYNGVNTGIFCENIFVQHPRRLL